MSYLSDFFFFFSPHSHTTFAYPRTGHALAWLEFSATVEIRTHDLQGQGSGHHRRRTSVHYLSCAWVAQINEIKSLAQNPGYQISRLFYLHFFKLFCLLRLHDAWFMWNYASSRLDWINGNFPEQREGYNLVDNKESNFSQLLFNESAITSKWHPLLVTWREKDELCWNKYCLEF